MTCSWRGSVIVAAALAVILLALRFGLPLWRVHQANLQEARRPLPEMAAPTRQDRILVLVPHCDDETLACGGLIARAVSNGAEVQVVVVTNGDGFRYAAERLFKEIKVPPQDYLAMARARQEETLAALSILGLASSHVVFLGYPDRGTAKMWISFWDSRHPYTSPYTRDNQNPYPNSLRPGAPYCGRSLLDDLETVISRSKPTIVFCPHPDDDHPDHWALYCYTLAALYELGMCDRVSLRLYLVHRGDWPVPQGLHLDMPMSPPAALTSLSTRWESLPLDSALARKKRDAILQYRSQVLVMKRFLLSFARSTEVLGQLSAKRLPVVAPGRILVDGDPGDWEGIAEAIQDPAQDPGRVNVNPAADVVKVYAAHDDQQLFLRIDLRKRVSSKLEYQVHLHRLSAGKVGPPQTLILRSHHSSPDVKFRAAGQCLEVSAPWPGPAASDGIMLGVESYVKHHLLDKTAWALMKAEKPSRMGKTPKRVLGFATIRESHIQGPT